MVSDEREVIKAQVRLLEKRVAILEKSLRNPIPLSKVAQSLGVSREILRRRIHEAIANPEVSSLIEGLHFERVGRNWQVLDFDEFKKALSENDIKFNRGRHAC